MAGRSSGDCAGAASGEGPRRFLICGVPRSGTTLLAEMVNGLQGVLVGPETHLLSVAGSPVDRRITRRTDLALLDRLPGTPSQLSPKVVADARSACSRGEAPDHLVDLLFWIVELHYPRRALLALGEKTPRHLVHARRCLNPTHRFGVVVIRVPSRPGEVAGQSPLERFNPNRERASMAPVRRYHSRAAADFPDRVKIVRFEDLVCSPELLLAEVSQFLAGVSLTRSTSSGQSPTFDVGAEPWKATALNAPDCSAAERWRSEPTSIDRIVALAAGRAVIEYGYSPPGAGIKESATVRLFVARSRCRYFAKSCIAGSTAPAPPPWIGLAVMTGQVVPGALTSVLTIRVRRCARW